MEIDFLAPLENDILDFAKDLSSQHLGSKIVFHTATSFPDLDKIDLAIIGVLENRGDCNSKKEVDLIPIRRELYSLFPGNWVASIADLGNVNEGNETTDTYFALKSLVASLIKKKIIPIIIGGSQDLTYPMYRSYDKLEQMVNLVSVDKQFDFGKEKDPISSNSYLTQIILEEPNNLFNYCNIGYQTYYNSQEEIDLIEKLYFDAYRLGEVSNSISIAEPVFRDADLVSIDMTVVKSSDSANFSYFSPNGFNGKEICALSRYAGISDKVTSLGIFNHGSTSGESILLAQIIWYFIEGYHCRSNEFPFGNRDHYIKYIVPIEEEELIFYKSNKTERWWIEVPLNLKGNNKSIINSLLPCSHEEYLAACNQETPERWWKAQRKHQI
jgi:arginase family enzyme